MKLNRSLSKKQIPVSVAKGSTIDLETKEGNRMIRQNSHKIMRSNSATKMTTQKSSGQKVEKKGVESGFAKKKSTVI